jgi:predicted O-methyltransferase YrrM
VPGTTENLIIPDGIVSAVTEEEARALAELAAGQDVLEMGAYHGFSTIVLASVASRVTSVDWHGGDVHAGMGPSRDLFTANLLRYDVLDHVDVRVGRFADVLPVLADEGALFDGLFLDAQHDAASVSADLDLALPLVRPGGFIAFHDYGRGPATGHPDFAVTEVADERVGITGRAGHLGWGFLPQ